MKYYIVFYGFDPTQYDQIVNCAVAAKGGMIQIVCIKDRHGKKKKKVRSDAPKRDKNDYDEDPVHPWDMCTQI